MNDYVREFRRKAIDFEETMLLLQNNERVKAKLSIDNLFTHLTSANVGFGILKLIEKYGAVPPSNVLADYIIEAENKDAERRLNASTARANASKRVDTISHKHPDTNLPKCPTCGSTNIQKLGVTTRAIDGFFFGRLSPEGRAQFWCKNCDYRW